MKKVRNLTAIILTLIMLMSAFSALSVTSFADESEPLTELYATVSGYKANGEVSATVVESGDVSYNTELFGWFDCENPFDVIKGENNLAPTDKFEGGRSYVVGVVFTPTGDTVFASGSLDVFINGEDGKIGEYTAVSRIYYITVFIPEVRNGWVEEDGKWYYYKDGTAQSGWFDIDGTWYLFRDDGYAEKGWIKSGRYWYYTDEKGLPKKNVWIKDSGKWYHMDVNGIMQTDWQKIGGKWYYFDFKGVLKTGWQKLNNKWYYFGGADSGAMRTGWQKINNKWYYFGGADDGVMKTGWQKINNKWYYFGGADDGVMKTGWQKISGKWYYFGGADDGVMKTGWVKSNGKWYYMDTNGAMVYNCSKKINGKTYKFNSSGVCTNP